MSSSRNFEAEYDDYKERRNAEVDLRKKRFETVAEEKHVKKEEKDFGLPRNEYKMQGYDEKPSNNVGADALAAVRTLRNNIRVLSLEHRERDEPVKEHLCKSACQDLSRAETKLTELSSQRSDAVFRGDSRKAEEIAKSMDQVKSDAIRNAYSDLMLDDKTMKAFGVNSKWTPDKNTMRADDWRPITPMVKRASTPKSREASATRRIESRRASVVVQVSKSVEMPKTTRKNERLSKIGHLPPSIGVEKPIAGGSMVQDDPYQAPTYVGRCPHCELTATGLGRSGEMERHYGRECKVMSSCKYCLKLTMISQLTDHYIYRCEFLTDTMVECDDCGLAIDKEDQRTKHSHPMCRGRKPPNGAQWCPLCTIAVDDNEMSWREHLVNNCYNNPRRDGPEKDPYQLKLEQEKIMRNYQEEEREKKIQKEKKKKEEEKKKAEQAQQQVQVVNQGYPGKMIDADKLVAALQEIQERKKAEKKKKLKEIENS